MTERGPGRDESLPAGDLVSFTARLMQSQGFADLYRNGMRLIDDVGDYLDGPGRAEARTLPRAVAVAYAAESMRLTTRLMQMAAWLLVQKSINEGGLLPSEAADEKAKVRFRAEGLATSASHFKQLPEPLQELIAQSLRLQTRILQIEALTGRPSDPVAPGARVQLELLQREFPGTPT